MGFTLNGNTSLIIVFLLSVVVVGAITSLSITGHAVPDIFTVTLAALGSAVGSGAVVNHVNQHYTSSIATTAAQTVVQQQQPPKTP